MTTPNDLMELAERLSEKQRAFLLSLPDDGDKHWPNGMGPAELEGLRGFGQSGLIISRYEHSGVWHRLSEPMKPPPAIYAPEPPHERGGGASTASVRLSAKARSGEGIY